jgi:phosphotriesterase-related protein
MSRFSSNFTRREALARGLRLLSAGIVAGAALPDTASAQTPSFPKGAVIRTLFKDYAPEELAGGATMFHEHVQLGTDFGDKFRAASNAVRALNGLPPQPPPTPPSGPQPPDPRRDPKLMAEQLNAARRDGIVCLVDAGHPDMGRDIGFARQAAMLSGLPVVAGAGFYSQPYYPTEIATMSEEQIVGALIQQVDEFPAGVFGEIGSWDEMTKDERKVFRAIGKAHVATNLSIFTHTGIPGKAAIEQLDILEDAGVKPDRVVIGHLGNLVDPNVYVHKTICRRGAFVGFDRQGGPNDVPDVPLVLALLEAGFEDHLLFSADQSQGFGRTLTGFVPKLRAAGANDAVLHKITVDNPRRFLAFVPKRPRKR